MFSFVIAIHILACVLLILIVLIQQGRGGGLVDTFSSAESIFGTKTNTFLIKSTSVLAVVFFFTCLGLAFLSIQKTKSLIETDYRPGADKATPAAAMNQSGTSSATPPASETTSAPVPVPAAAPSEQPAAQQTAPDETKVPAPVPAAPTTPEKVEK